jgi:filamentous hemagglutinin family protein
MSGVEIIKKKKVLLVLRPIALGVLLTFGGSLWANPVGPQVAAGAATFNSVGKTLTITNTPGTILNWQSFNIGAGELTRFQQQSALSAVLNRVTGGNPSSILGTLSSNGRVFLVNPHGIVFGAGSTINTAGFVASTLNISDADFLAGRLKFDGGGNGVLRNEGAIRASGDIFLVGPQIENAGLIRSDNGSVVLAAGQSVTITSPDAQGVQFALQAPTDAVLNLGIIEAGNAASLFAGTLKHSGDIRATSASIDANGRVILAAQAGRHRRRQCHDQRRQQRGPRRFGADHRRTRRAFRQRHGQRARRGGRRRDSRRRRLPGCKNPAVRNAARTFVGSDAKLTRPSAPMPPPAATAARSSSGPTMSPAISAMRDGARRCPRRQWRIWSRSPARTRWSSTARAGLEAVWRHGQAGLLLDPFNITLQAGAGTLDGFLSVPGDPLLAFGEPDNVDLRHPERGLAAGLHHRHRGTAGQQ